MATAGGTVHCADRQPARVPVFPLPRASSPHVDPVVDWDEAAVEALRARDYARLDSAGQVYLDYTGGGLYADSQIREHLAMLRSGVLGNPHSNSPSSLTSTELADGARRAILAFLNADPDDYTVVFTSNASGALRLVGEAYPFAPGRRLLLTADNHNSVNGIREFARGRGADVNYVPLTSDLRVVADALTDALDDPPADGGLFAYPAQSNYSGVRHPLEWIERAQARGWDVLLDAAALVPTSRLDLSRVQPDFIAISWYKAIGYPTGIGSLVARRSALAWLRRPWFGGGTISMASVATQRHLLSADEAGFEDGTIDYLGLPAIEIGLRHLEAITVETVHRRVAWLTERLLGRLRVLRHSNGSPLVRIYGPADTTDRGGTIAFNLLDPAGGLVGLREVERRAAEQRISLRTGCFCNPGASEAARGITAGEMERVFALGHAPTDAELAAIMPGKALGAVRASVGIATIERDLDRFIELLSAFAA